MAERPPRFVPRDSTNGLALFQKRSKAEFKNGSMNWAWTFEIFRIKGCKA